MIICGIFLLVYQISKKITLFGFNPCILFFIRIAATILYVLKNNNLLSGLLISYRKPHFISNLHSFFLNSYYSKASPASVKITVVLTQNLKMLNRDVLNLWPWRILLNLLYSYIHVLPDEFLFKLNSKQLINLKRPL